MLLFIIHCIKYDYDHNRFSEVMFFKLLQSEKKIEELTTALLKMGWGEEHEETLMSKLNLLLL